MELKYHFKHIGEVRVSYSVGIGLIKIEQRVKKPKTLFRKERIEWVKTYEGHVSLLKESLKAYDTLKEKAEPLEEVMRKREEQK